MKPIYLDYNATTPVAPEVVDAMLPYLCEHFGNASSAHAYGVAAHVGEWRGPNEGPAEPGAAACAGSDYPMPAAYYGISARAGR